MKIEIVRACVNKGFKEFFEEIQADIFCIQETKCQPEQIDLVLEGYTSYWNSAEKKGYSGTAIFTKKKPIAVTYGIGKEEHDKEGRIITLEFKDFYLVNNYTPNSKRELERLEYRQIWEDEIRKYLLKLNKTKPVIMCGDLNVASFRYLYPEKEGAYSWWSYMGKAREKNVGWRIDYFIVSNDIQKQIKEAAIYPEILGSDHCPVGIEINFE